MKTQQIVLAAASAEARPSTYQDHAYTILHLGFTVAPILFGLDKFLNLTTDWTKYVAPVIAGIIPATTFMLIVGVIEIAAGVLVWFKPTIGAYVVAAWLLGIIVNLVVLLGGYYDVALRDFGLLLGALALGRLSHAYAR